LAIDPEEPFPFKDFWSMLLTPKVWEQHKTFLDHFVPRIPDSYIPFTNNDPSKPIASSLHAVNLYSKDWTQIMNRHGRLKFALDWMKR
jgi:hypothetical protein